jgi:hypothetical protein
MRARISPHALSGTVRIPASKSHTIRCLLIASLAEGVSEIKYPLDSLDIRSCVAACRAFGAEIAEGRAADPQCPNAAAPDGSDFSPTKLVSFTVRGNNKFRRGGGFPDVYSSTLPALSAPPSRTPGFFAEAGCGLPPECGMGNSAAKSAEQLRVISDSFPLPAGKHGLYCCSRRGLVLLAGKKNAIEKISPGDMVAAAVKKGEKDPKSGAVMAELRSSGEDWC